MLLVRGPELDEIIQRLRSLETDHAGVEAKRAEHEVPKRLWESLSAFANTAGGGVILLGLDETARFAAVGVRNVKKVQADLASMCADLEPPLRPSIEPHPFEGVTLLAVEVQEVERARKPCYYKPAGLHSGAFIRVGDGDRRLTDYEIHLLVAGRGQPTDDQSAVPEASLDDLDRAQLAGLRARLSARLPKLAALDERAFLRTMKITTTCDGRDVPTVAAVLALCAYPQQFFPSLSLQLLVHETTELGAAERRFIDNRRIDGPISDMLGQAMSGLRQHVPRPTVVKGGRRSATESLYPDTALREVIVNALVHRDLSTSSRGTPVQINLFPDRLVVTNPGGLFGPVTIDRLGEPGVLAARNMTLMRLLEDLPGPEGSGPICENRGSGIAAMSHSLRRAGLRPPRFEDRIASFTVVFPAETLLDPGTVEWLGELQLEQSLSEPQRVALAMLRHGDELTNASLRAAIDLDSRDATRELRVLVASGLVEQIGERGGTSYRLAIKRDRRRQITRLLEEHGELSRAELEAHAQMESAATAWWIRRLRDEGLLEPTLPGRHPKVKYRLRRRRRR
jgi:ATP-dependent DNA helicase RecG